MSIYSHLAQCEAWPAAACLQNCGFEFRWGLGCLFLVNVVFGQVEAATSTTHFTYSYLNFTQIHPITLHYPLIWLRSI
jgi:hypothetical protein